MRDLVYLMGSSIPITDEILQKDIGIEKEGYRQRILFKLRAEYKEFSSDIKA